MNSDDEKLNQMLDSVQLKSASPDLAERIISASKASAAEADSSHPHAYANNEEENSTIFSLIANSFLVFKPAPAMACLLLAGVLSGWYIDNDVGQEYLQEERQEGLAVEDELLEFIDYEFTDYELSML